RSLMEAAEMSMRVWTRVRANMALGAYEMVEATGQLSEPEWPDVLFPDILKVAFRDRIVDRTDHPVLQRRLGLVQPWQNCHPVARSVTSDSMTICFRDTAAW